MRNEIKFFVLKLLLLYIILGFFPGVRLEFIASDKSSMIIKYIKYFFENLIHLWHLKILGVIILAIASIKTKKTKENKYKNVEK